MHGSKTVLSRFNRGQEALGTNFLVMGTNFLALLAFCATRLHFLSNLYHCAEPTHGTPNHVITVLQILTHQYLSARSRCENRLRHCSTQHHCPRSRPPATRQPARANSSFADQSTPQRAGRVVQLAPRLPDKPRYSSPDRYSAAQCAGEMCIGKQPLAE